MFLLKGLAAVAEVARTEDVGMDAVAALLRRDQDGNLYAEDSFSVQFKSASTQTIAYDEHALLWLLDQSLPMFVGRVSLQESRLSLYPLINVNAAVFSLHARRATIRFGTSELPQLLGAPLPWKGADGDEAIVWLGKPLLEWTPDQLTDSEWPELAYVVLKRFLGLARREYELISLKQSSLLTWDTNDPESIRSTLFMMKGHQDDLASIAERCTPGLRAIVMHAVAMPEQSANSLIAAAISLVAALRDIGIDIDSDELFSSAFTSLKSGGTGPAGSDNQP